jgi:type I restriction enzyme M protein
MANTKDQERDELHKAIWNIANDLRGSVDGWDFKQYVLGIMFYRYISENITNYINKDEHDAGNKDFDYTLISDEQAEQARKDMVKTKGFFILPSQLFCNVRKKAANDENLNETLEKTFKAIEASANGHDSEDDFKGLFDDLDVNSNKLGSTVVKRNEKLSKLLDRIAEMKLGDYKDNSIDAFGDAYEFLMGMYASNAGKSGGEYYTPQEVSELLTRITVVGKTEVNKVYDPACGSGSLLLKFAKVLGRSNVRQGFYGQEINLTTYNLCRINMFLHDIDYDKFNIACEDTLVSPQHWDDEPFEAIVSNPPYSTKWAGDSHLLAC